MSFFQPTQLEIERATPEEQRFLARSKHYFDEMAGYAIEQGTRPQTIGYLLADSPVGQAAWIYERFLESTDNCTNHGDALTHDDRGGHFAALEQPQLFVNELRATFHEDTRRNALGDRGSSKRRL
jgi:hypothetical protein